MPPVRRALRTVRNVPTAIAIIAWLALAGYTLTIVPNMHTVFVATLMGDCRLATDRIFGCLEYAQSFSFALTMLAAALLLVGSGLILNLVSGWLRSSVVNKDKPSLREMLGVAGIVLIVVTIAALCLHVTGVLMPSNLTEESVYDTERFLMEREHFETGTHYYDQSTQPGGLPLEPHEVG